MPAILAFIIGIVLFVILLKLVVALLAVAICIGLAGFVYFTAERLIGKGR